MPHAGGSGNLPHFVSIKGRQRDEFLRGLRVTEYDDISLFSLLCSYVIKTGSPKFHSGDFLAAVSAWAKSNNKPSLTGGGAKGGLGRLLDALERDGFVQRLEDGQTIILRDAGRRSGLGDRAAAEIEKIYARMDSDPLQPYPQTRDFEVPATALLPLKYTEFTQDFVEAHQDSNKILQVSFSEDVNVLVTPAVLPRLLDLARKKVHHFVQNNKSLTSFVFYELRKVLPGGESLTPERLYAVLENREDAEPVFWIYLALAITKSRDHDVLEPKVRWARMSLYQSAYLLHSYWQAEHVLHQQERQQEVDHRGIIAHLKRHARAFTLTEMEELRDRTGKPLREKYPGIQEFLRDLLEKQRTEADAANRVPELLQFDELYVHKEALPAMIARELDSMADACRGAVEAKWRNDLEQGNFSEETLQSDEAFATMLSELLHTRSPLLGRVLRKPRTLHLVLTELAEADSAMLKRHEALFEAPDRPVFKRADRLLHLDRQEIIGQIVSGMTLLRRFLLRRRFRLRREPSGKASGAQAQPKPRSASPAEKDQPVATTATLASPGAPAKEQRRAPSSRGTGAETEKGRRAKRTGPQTVPVKRRPRAGPRTMDEAVDQLKQAMVRKKQI